MGLHTLLRLFTVVASDHLHKTSLPYNAEAKHALQFIGTGGATQCTAGFNSSKMYEVAISTYFYCTSVIK